MIQFGINTPVRLDINDIGIYFVVDSRHNMFQDELISGFEGPLHNRPIEIF
jgi:hypothetical protein